ncbi:hypothetical protein [Aeromonas sp. s11]|uniref:hypothetical protein n=1 Tax=Aeromonas TaxID=642 RepID=UPI0034A399A8
MAIQINKIAMSPALMATAGSATAAAKPNILAIMGDDIGYWNISAYNQGMMGYQTPNLDRIANEGTLNRLLQISLNNHHILRDKLVV